MLDESYQLFIIITTIIALLVNSALAFKLSGTIHKSLATWRSKKLVVNNNLLITLTSKHKVNIDKTSDKTCSYSIDMYNNKKEH